MFRFWFETKNLGCSDVQRGRDGLSSVGNRLLEQLQFQQNF
jgi:hypothetical protein